LGFSACSSIPKLPPELLEIHAVLRRFPLANKNHRNIPTVALLEDRIGINIDFAKDGRRILSRAARWQTWLRRRGGILDAYRE